MMSDASLALGAVQVTITTFGYRHDAPPAAHLTIDLRHHFRDPHRVSKRLQQMTAHDAEIRQLVLATPGIRLLIDSAAAAVIAYLSGPTSGPVMVAVGCAGGRHRAATVGMELARALSHQDVSTALTHRDLTKDVVDR